MLASRVHMHARVKVTRHTIMELKRVDPLLVNFNIIARIERAPMKSHRVTLLCIVGWLFTNITLLSFANSVVDQFNNAYAEVSQLSNPAPNYPTFGDARFVHPGPIQSLWLSRSGRILTAGGYDNGIRIYESVTGKSLGTTLLTDESIKQVGFSSDLRAMVVATLDGDVKMFELDSGEIPRLASQTSIDQLKTPPGQLLFAGFFGGSQDIITFLKDGKVRTWQSKIQGVKEITLVDPSGIFPQSTSTIAFDKGNRIAVLNQDRRTINVWDATSGKLLCEGIKVSEDVRSLLGGEDSGKLIISTRTMLNLIDFEESPPVIRPINTAPKGAILLAVDRYAQRVALSNKAVSDRDYEIWIIDTRNGLVKWKLKWPYGAVKSAGFGNDDDLLSIGTDTGAIATWDLKTGRELNPPLGHRGEVTGVRFGLNDTSLVSCGTDQTIRFWDLTRRVPIGNPKIVGDSVRGLCFSKEGKWLLAACGSDQLRVWDSKSQSEKNLKDHFDDAVFDVASCSQSDICVTVGATGNIRLWNLTNWTVTREVNQAASTGLSRVAITPDGRHVICKSVFGHEPTVTSLDTTDGKVLFRITGVSIGCNVAISNDGGIFATTMDSGQVSCWSVKDGLKLTSIPKVEATCIAFDTSTKRIAIGNNNGEVMLFEVPTFRKLAGCRIAQSSVSSISFSKDGNKLACGAIDGTITLWPINNR